MLLHKGEEICRDCLFRSIEYKCRLTLENGIKVKPTDNILLCFSGGLNSICLANVMGNLKKRYQKNKLFGEVRCLHVQQQGHLDPDYPRRFKELTGLDLEVIKIEEIFEEEKLRTLQHVRDVLPMFGSSGNTVDLVSIFRDRLVLEYSKKHGFQVNLKCLNGESLASEIFKYFAKGVGGNLSELSSQGETPLFEYPLKQHLQKELQYYYYSEKLSALALKAEEDDLSNSYSSPLDSLIKNFISTLQDMHSHTAPAIFRTGERIQSNRPNENVCLWCFLRGTVGEGRLCRKCLRLHEAKNKSYKS